MSSPVQLKILVNLNNRIARDRIREKSIQRYDNRAVVEANTSKGYRVRTALGNTFYVKSDRVNTNSSVVGQKVVAVRPVMGGAFIDGVIRGK